MQNSFILPQSSGNAPRALANYNLAISWGWSLNEAITFASDQLENPAEIDQLQILLHEQYIKQMGKQMQQFLETVTDDLF